MKYRLLSIILMTITILSLSRTQSLWNLEVQEGNYIAALISVGNDTSINHLKQLISNGASLSIPYDVAYDAAWLLSYYHGSTEKEFILSHMRNWIEDLKLSNTTLFELYYFKYQYLRGYLGDQGAIAGMDTVIQYYHGSGYLKLWPIQLLAEAGQYNYFSMIKNRVDEDVIPILGLYGRDSRFTNEIRDTLGAYIRRSTNKINLSLGVKALANFDKSYAIIILDELFHNSSGKIRKDYFEELSRLDFDGQPERTMWVIPNETDDTLRNDYFPYAGSVQSNRRSNRYFEPFFIKYAIDRLAIESSTWVKHDIEWFLNNFIPLIPPDSISVNIQLDTLISFKTQVASYGWVGDNAFVNELTGYLTNARNALTSGDSSACARNIFIFQNKVDEEYRDSLDGDTHTINTEGWKFLHYHAQFILERLSANVKISLPIKRELR